MSWGIVVESRKNIERWVDVVSAGLNIFMLIPFSDGDGRLIGKTKEEKLIVAEADCRELLAKVSLLTCDDARHDDVESRFDGYEVFLPDDQGPRRLPQSGFWKHGQACGASRLLRLRTRSAFDLQLRAAARLAIYNRLAIEFRY